MLLPGAFPWHRVRSLRRGEAHWGLPLWSVWVLILTFVVPSQGQRGEVSDTLTNVARLRASGNVVAAVKTLESALEREPEEVDLLTALAQLRLDQRDTVQAVALLNRALDTSPNAVSANRLLGSVLLSKGRLPEAMDRFETVLAVAPHDPEARAGEFTAATQLAQQADVAGNKAAAYACLEHAAESIPDNAELLTNEGMIAGQLHQPKHAEAAFIRALTVEPGRPVTLYAMAREEIDAHAFPEAEQHLRAYLRARPNDATAHYGLGRLLHIEQRDSEADKELRRSVELVPVQTESYYELGAIALQGRRDAEATALFQRTLERDPRHGGALTGMGEIAYRARDFAAAKRTLTAAVASAPDYQPAHYYLGLTLTRLGEKEAAEAELLRATELERVQQSKATPVAEEAPIQPAIPRQP